MVKTDFKPSFVFIPTDADPADIKTCTLLMSAGDNNHCLLYEEGDTIPKFVYRHGEVMRLVDGEEVPVEDGKVEMVPEIWIVKLPEKQYWCADIANKVKRLFGVYAFNRKKHVHLCSFTPCYELNFIETQYEEVEMTKAESDRLSEEIRETDDSTDEFDVRYMDVSFIESIIANKCKDGFLPENDKGGGFAFFPDSVDWATDEIAMEATLEYARGNCT